MFRSDETVGGRGGGIRQSATLSQDAQWAVREMRAMLQGRGGQKKKLYSIYNFWRLILPQIRMS